MHQIALLVALSATTGIFGGRFGGKSNRAYRNSPSYRTTYTYNPSYAQQRQQTNQVLAPAVQPAPAVAAAAVGAAAPPQAAAPVAANRTRSYSTTLRPRYAVAADPNCAPGGT